MLCSFFPTGVNILFQKATANNSSAHRELGEGERKEERKKESEREKDREREREREREKDRNRDREEGLKSFVDRREREREGRERWEGAGKKLFKFWNLL